MELISELEEERSGRRRGVDTFVVDAGGGGEVLTDVDPSSLCLLFELIGNNFPKNAFSLFSSLGLLISSSPFNFELFFFSFPSLTSFLSSLNSFKFSRRRVA
jgi:hypothetical protein